MKRFILNKNFLVRISVFVCLPVLIFQQFSAIASADTTCSQTEIYKSSIHYFDCAAATSCDSSGTSTTGTGAKGAWNSGLQPPYILEQYAINVLEDLAQKNGKPTTDTVTPQHVLALVTWAILEGGDIQNTDLFNPWNTSQNDNGLGAVQQSTGNMAYPSFDQGVEAATRTINDGNHNGMLKALLNSNSTATDFAHAESYSGTDPGTLIWAQAAKDNPSGYYSGTWLPQLQTVGSDYKNYGSIVIGTSAFEQQAGIKDPSKLSGIISGGSITASGTTIASTPDCSSSTSSNGASGTVDAALAAAKAIGASGKPYCNNTQCPRGVLQQDVHAAVGYDCSSSTSWVLLTAGFKLPGNVTWGASAPVSGDYANWGDPGPGQEMTIWENPDHIFIEFKIPGQGHFQMNTSVPGHDGPDFAPWGPMGSVDAANGSFTARHWPGT